MIGQVERSRACYKADGMCVEMIVHVWFCLDPRPGLLSYDTYKSLRFKTLKCVSFYIYIYM